MTVELRITYVFNQVYLNLLKDIKKKDPIFRNTVKEHYKVFDKKSDEYIHEFLANMSEDLQSCLFCESDILDNINVLNMKLYKNITVNDILTKAVKNNETDKNTVRYYMYILLLMAFLNKDSMDDNKKNILLDASINIIGHLDKNQLSVEDFEAMLDKEGIVDDDISKVLRKILENRSEVIQFSETDVPKRNDFPDMDMLKDSKIGNLAKEISESINLSDLNLGNMEEGMDIGKLMNGENQAVLGNIIQTVGTKITEKMQNGELNQDELMSEAFGLMGKMNPSSMGMGNDSTVDMMSQMMNMMSQQPGFASFANATAQAPQAVRESIEYNPNTPVKNRLKKKSLSKK
tara:strand:+ start:466 stop:1506 length:1041 start_codon:yes stop_codon:yes gene_type:complete